MKSNNKVVVGIAIVNKLQRTMSTERVVVKKTKTVDKVVKKLFTPLGYCYIYLHFADE